MGANIIGRAGEQSTIAGALEGVDGPAGVAIDGEPGIGKSTLWIAAIAAVEERGSVVLSARPASSEVRLSFSGLVDLLDPRTDDAIRALPEPQRRSIEVALYRRPAEPGPEAGLVGVAVLQVLRALAAERPLVVAIDDLQWLDAPSLLALEYAIRRLRTEPVAVLTASRIEGGTDPAAGSRADLVGLLPAHRVTRITLGPLTIGAVHHLIQTALGSPLPRPVLARIHDRSVGNPFYALELARHWLERVDQGGRAWVDTALPASVSELVLGRLAGLPKRVLGTLLVVALAGQPSIALIADVLDRTVDGVERDLDVAGAAGVLERIAGGSVRIGHPLLADAIADAAPATRRRMIHRRLAAAAVDAEVRARHLAAADDQPDAATAAALVEAAESAAGRGASGAAVELYEAAVRRWPADDPAGARRVRYNSPSGSSSAATSPARWRVCRPSSRPSATTRSGPRPRSSSQRWSASRAARSLPAGCSRTRSPGRPTGQAADGCTPGWRGCTRTTRRLGSRPERPPSSCSTLRSTRRPTRSP